MNAQPCRHCRDPRRPVNRPRGLCWNCYYTPGVRDRYQSESKYGRRGIGHGGGGYVLPVEPTAAAPGSPEKVAVLVRRAAEKVCLWHPLDAPLVPAGGEGNTQADDPPEDD